MTLPSRNNIQWSEVKYATSHSHRSCTSVTNMCISPFVSSDMPRYDKPVLLALPDSVWQSIEYPRLESVIRVSGSLVIILRGTDEPDMSTKHCEAPLNSYIGLWALSISSQGRVTLLKEHAQGRIQRGWRPPFPKPNWLDNDQNCQNIGIYFTIFLTHKIY